MLGRFPEAEGGLATGIGGAVAFVPQIFASVKQGVILSVALAISAGVMLYVSFIEIFVKAQAEIEKSLGPSGAAATTTACFFAGMLFCVVLELLVHKCMGHGRAVPPSGAATSATDGGSPGEVSVELGNVTEGAQDARRSPTATRRSPPRRWSRRRSSRRWAR